MATVLAGAQVSPSGEPGPIGLSTTPLNYLSGLMLSINVTDALNDIDISQGVCRDTTNTADIILLSPMTKQLDVEWAVGNNQGGREIGTTDVGAWYHVFAIRNPTTNVCDVLFALSPSAPIVPSGFTQWRRIGSIWRYDSTSGNRWFAQLSQTYFQISYVHHSLTISYQGTGGIYYASTPYGIKTRADLILIAYGANGNVGVSWFDPDQPGGSAGTITQWNVITVAAGYQSTTCAIIWTSVTDAMIYAYLWGGSATGAYTNMQTLGWYDDWLLIGK